jgi:hypothetical protein
MSTGNREDAGQRLGRTVRINPSRLRLARQYFAATCRTTLSNAQRFDLATG